jgi:hypothetical protein
VSKRPADFFEKLSALVPVPPRPEHVAPPIDDLTRIMALPRREPYDCLRDEHGHYNPTTQALIEHVTAQFTRGARATCGCQQRTVERLSQDVFSIYNHQPKNVDPRPPIIVTFAQLVADAQPWNKDDQKFLERAGNMRSGEVWEVPTVDGDISKPCIVQLNAQQAWTLHEAPQVGGILGFKGVGSGKTMSGILVVLCFPEARLAVILIEPKQRGHYRKHYLRAREHFRVPSIISDDEQTRYVVPGTVPTHLISFSKLSRTENSDLLDARDPDVLVIDEGHRACGDSAINRRVKRYIASRLKKREEDMAAGKPVARRAVFTLSWSGTLENRTAQDTHMLSTYALGQGSPLPHEPDAMVAWAGVMDPSRKPDRKSKTAHRLYDAFVGGPGLSSDSDIDFSEPEVDIRRGFQAHRARTLGVITASASSVNASIYFAARKAPKMPDVIRSALRGVRIDEVRPDGEELTERLEQVMAAREILSGFYTYWAFPKLKCTCGVMKCEGCLHIDKWFALRKPFNKELRSKAREGQVNLDSRKLLEDAARRFWQSPPYKGELPTWKSEYWPAWAAIENTIEYVEKHKWICEHTLASVPCTCSPEEHPGYYLARDAAKWAKENKGVVWFKSTPFGRKIAELSGLPYFNGGPGCEDRLSAEKGDRSIICSIKALGSGTDGLQFKFHKQLITEMPASNGGNEGMEQLLGRLHRQGQPEDVVETYAYLHAPELYDAFEKVKTEAMWQSDMQKLQQRILLADEDMSEL